MWSPSDAMAGMRDDGVVTGFGMGSIDFFKNTLRTRHINFIMNETSLSINTWTKILSSDFHFSFNNNIFGNIIKVLYMVINGILLVVYMWSAKIVPLLSTPGLYGSDIPPFHQNAEMDKNIQFLKTKQCLFNNSFTTKFSLKMFKKTWTKCRY